MAHGHGAAAHDEHGVPISQGIAPSMLLFLTVATIIIFIQGILVEIAAPSYKVWPAGDSTKVQLPAPTL